MTISCAPTSVLFQLIQNLQHFFQQSSTISIHHTKGGRRFLAVGNNSTNNKPKLRDTSTNHQMPPCKLCLNKHTNPWHSEDDCPNKHPTQIIPKHIRERVMQHNALHGAENRNYSKNQDTPDATEHLLLQPVIVQLLLLLKFFLNYLQINLHPTLIQIPHKLPSMILIQH